MQEDKGWVILVKSITNFQFRIAEKEEEMEIVLLGKYMVLFGLGMCTGRALGKKDFMYAAALLSVTIGFWFVFFLG